MEIKDWITVNGNHIPIIEGDSKAKAIAKFFKNKRQKDTKRQIIKGRAKTLQEKQQERAEIKSKIRKTVKRESPYFSDEDVEKVTEFRTAREFEDIMRNKYGKDWKKSKSYRLRKYQTENEIKIAKDKWTTAQKEKIRNEVSRMSTGRLIKELQGIERTIQRAKMNDRIVHDIDIIAEEVLMKELVRRKWK